MQYSNQAARPGDGMMIYKRAIAKLRTQEWPAIAIELAIVVVGVFLGTWVANWNEERVEQKDIVRLLQQLHPEVARFEDEIQDARTYYAVTDRSAHVALAGWAGNPTVSDHDFVIAAYQASQIRAIAADSQSYSQLLGGDQVRKIENQDLRAAVMRLINYDFEPLQLPVMRTRYRDNVRQLIPQAIQEKVRAQCGDRDTATGRIVLPARCDIALPAKDVEEGAAALRAQPQLAGELRQHQATVATFLYNVDRLEFRLRKVSELNR